MVFIKDKTLRSQFAKTQERNVQGEINTFGVVATEAAYRESEAWLEELLSYLEANRTFVCDFLTEQLPAVTSQKPEGTYLIWLDFSAYGLTDNQLQRKLIKEANVVLNQGSIFGPRGSHHMRLNFACPKELLEKALNQIAAAFKDQPIG